MGGMSLKEEGVEALSKSLSSLDTKWGTAVNKDTDDIFAACGCAAQIFPPTKLTTSLSILVTAQSATWASVALDCGPRANLRRFFLYTHQCRKLKCVKLPFDSKAAGMGHYALPPEQMHFLRK